MSGTSETSASRVALGDIKVKHGFFGALLIGMGLQTFILTGQVFSLDTCMMPIGTPRQPWDTLQALLL